ncbi:MAG: hypothetical protein EAZ24_10700 [Burkholderiales bacterium]|nr:MAG: hypothetical protein EAZ24_10700 [Burkholderiales bacterium]TAG78406.1 MAG: hypothetical protein EAZ21_12785 [Betaproteobacteria bacterium]
MQKRWLSLLLLCTIFWQGFAYAGQGLPLMQPNDLEHAALHWQDSAHHHHEDGAVEQDDSSASLQHLAADCAGTVAALIGNSTLPPAEFFSPTLPPFDCLAIPLPLRERIQRPPR